jgi:hypothetical protein
MVKNFITSAQGTDVIKRFVVTDVTIKLANIWLAQKLVSDQSDQKFEKNCPIFGNVAKTVAKLQKLKLKVKNSFIKMLLNVKISTTNCVLKLLI